MTNKETYNILFVGDIVGRPGRKMLESNLAKLQWDKDIDLTIINGENSSGGKGMNSQALRFFKELGVDAITMGNHTWDNRDIFTLIDREKNIARPLNYGKNLPGVGYVIVPMGEIKVAVVSLICRTNMQNVIADCPFQAIEDVLPELKAKADVIFVDVHGETTSEKICLGRFLDGKVSAVIGTHTHVQTNDARILPGGTAYLTDAGMTGPRDSVLGIEFEPIIDKFRTGIPCKFQVADGDLQFNGVIVTVDKNGTAKDIKLINFFEENF